ncbi:nucleotidyltransferase domain-containing protein [Methylorubrum extorquens]
MQAVSVITHAAIPESAATALRHLTDSPKVVFVILFGSRAVGDQDERSDIDIAFSAPELSKGELALIRDKVELSRSLYKISISQIERMPASLRERVLDQGVIVYEQSKAD